MKGNIDIKRLGDRILKSTSAYVGLQVWLEEYIKK